MASRTPAFRLVMGDRDLTALARDRLIGLSITEDREERADQLDLQLDDADGRLALPKRGEVLGVALGWAGGDLVDKGLFKVDEVEHAGAPDTITVRARSADLAGEIRVRREQSWTDTTLGAVLAEVAGRNGLELRIAPELAALPLPVLAQSRESDVNLLTRLGRAYDAVAAVKAGRLIFSPVGRGQTPTGLVFPKVTLTRSDGDRHRFLAADREAYTGVSASYHDVGEGKRHRIAAGQGDPDAGKGEGKVKHLRRTYATKAQAEQAAAAERARLARGALSLSFTLAYGRPELYPEQRVQVLGIKPDIDAVEWLIKTATHTLSASGEGLVTVLDLEDGLVLAPAALEQLRDLGPDAVLGRHQVLAQALGEGEQPPA